jgi:hypothetical protein
MRRHEICQPYPKSKLLILFEKCFAVVQDEKFYQQICMDDLAYPLDGVENFDRILYPGDKVKLFDNEFDTPPTPELRDKHPLARGSIVYVEYPIENDFGKEIPLENKSCFVHVQDYNQNNFTNPVNELHCQLNNPVTSDPNLIINKIEVENPQDFQIYVEALVLYNKNKYT